MARGPRVQSPPMPAPRSRPDGREGDLQRLRDRTRRRLARPAPGPVLLSGRPAPRPRDPVEQRLLDHELAIAQELQANLLPQRVPRLDGLEVGAFYRPTREVGGDYYDFLEVDSDHLGFAVADVSGKGIPGCIVMTETRALLRSEAGRSRSPAEVLRRVNRLLHPDLRRGMFVTALYALYERRTRTLTVSGAGHPPAILWRRASASLHLIRGGGLGLGIDKGPLFDKAVREHRVELAEGDRLVLYTDGIPESMDADEREFGQDRLCERVRLSAGASTSQFIDSLLADLAAHRGDAPQHDDITLVCARVTASR